MHSRDTKEGDYNYPYKEEYIHMALGVYEKLDSRRMACRALCPETICTIQDERL